MHVTRWPHAVIEHWELAPQLPIQQTHTHVVRGAEHMQAHAHVKPGRLRSQATPIVWKVADHDTTQNLPMHGH